MEDSIDQFFNDYEPTAVQLEPETSSQTFTFTSLEPQTDAVSNLVCILKLFINKSNRASNDKGKNFPKKDNFVTFIIRALMNLLKNMVNNTKTIKESIKIDSRDPIHARSHAALVDIYSRNVETVKFFLNRENRPINSRRTASCQINSSIEDSQEL